jgi:hypothetical protein
MLAHRLKRAANGQRLSPTTLFAASENTGQFTSTVDLPADIEANDFIVIYDFSSNGIAATPTLVIPSGFTNRLSYDLKSGATTQARRLALHSKIATGAEGGSTVNVMYKPQFGRAMVLVFRTASQALSSVVFSDSDVYASDGTIANQTVLSSESSGEITITLAYGRSGTSAASPTLNGDEDGLYTGTAADQIAYKIDNETPATNYTAVISDGGLGNVLASCYFELNR